MQNGLYQNYLSVSVPDSVGNISSYKNLGNVEDTQIILANTQLYYNCFPPHPPPPPPTPPSVIREWNRLLQETRYTTTTASFENKMNENNIKTPTYYFDCRRKEQIYNTRIRMNCSSLNQHLYSPNIIDRPLRYEAIEETNYYLLHCLLF